MIKTLEQRKVHLTKDEREFLIEKIAEALLTARDVELVLLFGQLYYPISERDFEDYRDEVHI